ncbi:hypothetical protein UA08_01814 [Talaromyces atroroseus]|uniref:Uncharacterized protein n=1 Tax=Talaromyces atroroseus TaxID=1441469 RepID=A0A1Q5QA74_TALAT|nr:hypothetical protein UA08_01814 [Talaromyces atroroseus]OKL62844.1 hypothetical protein UA08_01814 [Talaromyces atroroseus]
MEKQYTAPVSPVIEEDDMNHQENGSSSDSESLPGNSGQVYDAPSTVTSIECIAHLKFLAVLAQLQHAIRTKDGLFKINKPKKHSPLLEDATIKSRVEEKRWQVYVSRAVDRFTQWWLTLPTYKEPPTVMSLKRFEMDPLTLDQDARIVLTKDQLPPLDVLMVWHSFMLNPRAYLEDCFRQAKMNLWATPFPWDLVSNCITLDQDEKYSYDPGETAKKIWLSRTDKKWDNLDDSLRHTVECLLCHSKTRVLWTTASINMFDPTVLERYGVPGGFDYAQGYADKSFNIVCSGCEETLDHDYLPVLKFRNDNIALIERQLPLPGTVYNPDGVVKNRKKWRARWAQLTPNYYFLAIGKDFIKYLDKHGTKCRSIRKLADGIHTNLYRRNMKIKVLDMDSELANSDMFQTEKGRGRGTLRRMMSRYWGGNSSIFAMDLVGAVIRQGTFVQKMHKLNWLHSYPMSDLPQLMERFMAKYNVFWKIIVDNPSQMVVPTLDVDLVWHTHQLAPKRYYTHSIETTKHKKPIRFIDHNDKIDEGRLSDSFTWTVKQYRKATGGQVYSECLCWYCQVTRGEGILEKLSLAPQVSKQLEKLRIEKNGTLEETTAAHISAHNAVRAQGPVFRNRRKELEKIIKQHEKQEHGTGGQYRKAKKNQAQRQTLFEVFEKDFPLHQDAYIYNPSCMSMDKDAVGNCIAGACSPSMAAGSCGGSTFNSSCASTARSHGTGFRYIEYKGAGGAGGVGCGGGC